MVSHGAFGPNLRRQRMRRGVSLDTIAAVTNVPVALWQALEDNDLYGWPSGVLARAFVSEYARLVGLDPQEVVNDFCRLFPQGERRRTPIMAEYAAIIGQPLVWTDDLPRGPERRAPMMRLDEERRRSRLERVAAVLVECAAILIVTAISAGVLRLMYSARLFAIGAAYYLTSAALGRSLGEWAVRMCDSRANAGRGQVPISTRAERPIHE